MNVRLAVLVAGAFVIALGIVFVLLPQGGGGQDGEQTAGLPSTVVAGVLVVIVGLALLVLAILNRAWATKAQAAPAAKTASEPIQPGSSPIGMSSEAEAAVVRLLDEDERLMYIRLRDEGGQALQREIVAWRTFSPAKVSRLLDRLEAKGLVVRERHGSTNRVRLTRYPVISSK